jgi:hypothetical protein
MLKLAGMTSAAALMAGVLALGGCATQEAVEKAQMTADSAMTHAQAGEAAAARAQASADAAGSAAAAAGSAAQRAQSTADGATSAAAAAQSTANQAAADAKNANDRLDKQTPQVAHLMHHHKHRTFKNVAHKK